MQQGSALAVMEETLNANTDSGKTQRQMQGFDIGEIQTGMNNCNCSHWSTTTIIKSTTFTISQQDVDTVTWGEGGAVIQMM